MLRFMLCLLKHTHHTQTHPHEYTQTHIHTHTTVKRHKAALSLIRILQINRTIKLLCYPLVKYIQTNVCSNNMYVMYILILMSSKSRRRHKRRWFGIRNYNINLLKSFYYWFSGFWFAG